MAVLLNHLRNQKNKITVKDPTRTDWLRLLSWTQVLVYNEKTLWVLLKWWWIWTRCLRNRGYLNSNTLLSRWFSRRLDKTAKVFGWECNCKILVWWNSIIFSFQADSFRLLVVTVILALVRLLWAWWTGKSLNFHKAFTTDSITKMNFGIF